MVEIYYNYGSIYFAYRSKIPDDERNAEARNKYQKMVKKYFENTIEAGKKDPRERVRVKKWQLFYSIVHQLWHELK